MATIGMIPLGRLGEVTDLMGPFVFLASEASSLMTGSSMLVDGGWTARSVSYTHLTLPTICSV